MMSRSRSEKSNAMWINEKQQASQGSPQTGAPKYTTNELPKQHQTKLESERTPAPMYDAPYYKGSGKLQDMVAIITGGDSGIGRAVCEGADVAIGYIDEESDVQETKDAIEKEGRRALLLPGNIPDPDYADESVKIVIQELGKLDILINNAAFQQHCSSIEELSLDQFDRTMKTNLNGMYNMTKKPPIPHLKEGSSIIDTGIDRCEYKHINRFHFSHCR